MPKGTVTENTITTTVRLPGSLHERISNAAKRDKRSFNSYVERKLDEAVPKKDK